MEETTEKDNVFEINAGSRPGANQLKPIELKRLDQAYDLSESDLSDDDRWYLHSILTQCFLPYRDPKTERWVKQNGHYGIAIQSGVVPSPNNEGYESPGIPYGAKPRLINCYVQTYAVKHQTPVIPIANSMSGFMKELGFKVTGGAKGSIRGFQEQCTRLSISKWTIWGPKNNNTGITLENAEPFRRIDLWYPSDPDQKTLWPSELELQSEFFESLIEHAIPYDYRALKILRSNARAQDVYLWMTQRLHRISRRKPLRLKTEHLFEMFGGGIKEIRKFPDKFDEALKIALLAYQDANVEKLSNGDYLFKSSPPPIKKVTSFLEK